MRPATYERKPETVIDLEHFVKSYAQFIATDRQTYARSGMLIKTPTLH